LVYQRVGRKSLGDLSLRERLPLGPHRAHHTGMTQRASIGNSGLLRAFFGAAVMLSFASVPALAQGRPMPVPVKMPTIPSKEKIVLPKQFAPPTGMCRVWIDGVPADQQPAPTDCATAVKNRPVNGKVIFSDEKATSPKPSKKKKDDESSL
jgi:hypothetical protein